MKANGATHKKKKRKNRRRLRRNNEKTETKVPNAFARARWSSSPSSSSSSSLVVRRDRRQSVVYTPPGGDFAYRFSTIFRSETSLRSKRRIIVGTPTPTGTRTAVARIPFIVHLRARPPDPPRGKYIVNTCVCNARSCVCNGRSRTFAIVTAIATSSRRSPRTVYDCDRFRRRRPKIARGVARSDHAYTRAPQTPRFRSANRTSRSRSDVCFFGVPPLPYPVQRSKRSTRSLTTNRIRRLLSGTVATCPYSWTRNPVARQRGDKTYVYIGAILGDHARDALTKSDFDVNCIRYARRVFVYEYTGTGFVVNTNVHERAKRSNNERMKIVNTIGRTICSNTINERRKRRSRLPRRIEK